MLALDRRLKIAFVIHDFNRYLGQGRYVSELADRFKRDHEVHVFANTFDPSVPDGLTYHHVPAIRGRALATILSFVLPATLLVRGRFDIIHSQGLCGLRHNVVTAHFCQPGWSDALARANGKLTWSQSLSRMLITPLENHAFAKRSTRRVIAISKRVAADLDRYYGLKSRSKVIYHGVDLETFHPRGRKLYRDGMRAELGLSMDECAALYVGNLEKGGAAAIRATARVPGMRLILVSASNNEAARSLADSEGVIDRVLFRNYTKQIERYFATADIFVYPTFYDTFGMVISEAMAAGLSVITSDAAGASELIEHGESGWLTAEPWAIDEIAAGLRTLMADEELRHKIGRAARARIETLSWDLAAEKTLAVYREV